MDFNPLEGNSSNLNALDFFDGLTDCQISRVWYKGEEFDEESGHSFEKLARPPDREDGITWIHISGVAPLRIIEWLGEQFHLHPLLTEDIMSGCQRCKLDDYQEILFVVMRSLSFKGKGISNQQVSVVFSERFVISFAPYEITFEDIRLRLRKANPRIRNSSTDYLVYNLIDYVVDHTFLILGNVTEQMEDLEEELTQQPSSKTLLKIQRMKREVSVLRQSAWPMREVINQFRHLETHLIHPSTLVFMNDVYDHAVQTIESIDTFRDVISGMMDIYLSTLSYKMNEIIKFLTIVSTVFVPLTFLSSVYGMNFKVMPELDWRFGYLSFWVMVVLLTGSMLYYFRKKKWI